MGTMVGLLAAPEVRGFNEDLAEYYQLPRFGIGGMCGSKEVDQQAAYEAAITLLTSTLAGAGLIHDVGYMDNGTTGALDQLVICHEIIGWVKRYMKQLTVDDETLALDVIAEVVKKDGSFLETEHTLRHFREDYYPEFTDRDNYDNWQAEGSLTLRDRARTKVNQILKEEHTATLPTATLEELRSLVVGN